MHELAKLVTDLIIHLDELTLDDRQKNRAKAQLAVLKAELSGEPDANMIKQAVRTLRNITEGAIGSLLASAVTQPAVWKSILRTLNSN